MKSKFDDHERFKALSILNKHIGKQNAISMPRLHEKVFGERPTSHISGTRKLRALITELRNEGEPICSITCGGYYFAATESEREEYLSTLKHQAIKKLLIISRIKKMSALELCNQIALGLENELVPAE